MQPNVAIIFKDAPVRFPAQGTWQKAGSKNISGEVASSGRVEFKEAGLAKGSD